MEPLLIQQSNATLGVDFDPRSNRLVLRGESYPEDARKFFAPVLQWLKTYFQELPAGVDVQVVMDIVYFNSSSSKALMNVFDVFENAARSGARVEILWMHHVENEVAQECGEEFGEELQAAGFRMQAYEDAS